MNATKLASNLYLLDGAVTTGALVAGSTALLFDCCDTVTPERLAELGVETAEMILCTQHRRPNVAGAHTFVAAGARLVAPATERALFEETDAYWSDPKNRWHIYHHRPGPQVLARPIPVWRAVADGDVVEWEGASIRVLDTPGGTDGGVSYLVDADGTTFCFCGDVLYDAGMLWDFHSLQKGHGCVGDYHGFMGNRQKLIPSLEKIAGCGADALVPSHGQVVRSPRAAAALTIARASSAMPESNRLTEAASNSASSR